MTNQLKSKTASSLILPSNTIVPALVSEAGENASRKYIEFFTAKIRNRGTRHVYAHAVLNFFGWCSAHGLTLRQVEPVVVAAYIEEISQSLAAPTVKVRLAAIRMLFDYLVTGQVIPFNPAAPVRGPKHVVKTGKTPVLSAELTRELLDSIDCSTIVGLRDRALIGVMVFSFARISATLGINIEDYHQQGRQMWFRFREKGGKHHAVPAHHKAIEYIDAYFVAAGLEATNKDEPIFRTIGPNKQLSERRMSRTDALRMVKRRAKAIGLSEGICCHTWRATGITNYLQNGGSLENAMQIACHESARTTKLYDRTCDEVSLAEIERIRV